MRRVFSPFALTIFTVLGGWLTVAADGAAAQAPPVQAVPAGYAVASWTDANGRPLGSVHALAQDADGYLWVGTDSGLLRFDGARFTAWEDVGEPALPAGPVTAVHVGADGTLWIGLGNGGLRRARGGLLAPPFPHDDRLGPVTDIVEDKARRVYVVGNASLWTLETDGWRRVPLPWPRSEGRVLQPYVSRNGQLWVATRWGVFERTAPAQFRLATDRYVWGVAEDGAGRIWTTDTNRGLRPLATEPPRGPALDGAGYRLLQDRRGGWWLGTFGDGLWHTDARGVVIEQTSLRSGLSADSVLALQEDREGNIWVGTTAGLHRLSRRRVLPVDDVGFVLAVESDGQGGIWAATTNGIVRFGRRDTGWVAQRMTTPAPDVRSIHRDSHNRVWIGATDGLWRLDGEHPRHLTPAFTQPPILTALTSDPQGDVWAGDGLRLFRWNGSRLSAEQAATADMHARVALIGGDRQGRRWVALADGVIAYLDRSGALHQVHSPPPRGETGDRLARTAVEGRDGTVWIGGGQGLGRYARGGRFETLAPENGLPDGRVWSVTEDRGGRLWLNGDRGIVVVAREELEAAFRNPRHRLQYRLFTPSDGVAGSIAGIIQARESTDGTLWFVRGGGLTAIDPAAIESALPPTAVARIEHAVADDRRRPAAPNATFGPGLQRLQIDYTAVALASAQRLRFRYRLDGLDTEWVDAGSRRTAYYTNLWPGQYRFQVQAMTDDGAVAATTAAWAFTIQPTFVQTAWFPVLLLTAGGVLIWAAWRARIGMVRRQFSAALSERTRLSHEIHDTLLQSLVGVALRLTDLSKRLGPDTESARESLTRLRREVESHIRETRHSIFELRSPMLDGSDLPRAIADYGRRAVSGTATRFTFSVSGTARPAGARLDNALLRIGSEAIGNAVRHAGAAVIHCELRYDTDTVTLRVTDDGRGFDAQTGAAHGPGHFGLTTMRERAEAMRGRFEVVSSHGRGTQVSVIMPAGDHADRMEGAA